MHPRYPAERKRSGLGPSRCEHGSPNVGSPETDSRRKIVSTVEQPVEVDGDK